MNLAKACGYCNSKKHTFIEAIDPQTKHLAPLFHPRKQKWEDHFQWSEDRLMIEGKTSTGRATVVLLDMNSEEIVNLRSILPESDHPPK